MFATTIIGYTLSGIWLLFWSVLAVLIWIFLAFLPARIAKAKGKSFWLYFIISLFFWWITFFVVLLMKDESGTTTPTPKANE